MEASTPTFAVGDQVTILRHKTKKFVDEPGTVIAFCGEGLKEYAIVAAAGQQPLVKLEDLRA